MKLKTKLILNFLLIGIVPLFIFSLIGIFIINKIIFNDFYEFYQGQLYHIKNNINTLINDVKFDIDNLSQNKYVTTRNDNNFTNFLNADENTFKYNFNPAEQKIVDIFHSYLITHPYINSVYMGRENGSFVRSHPRPKPTKYDPRERPWYKLAKENPDKIMITEPYISVTSNDVNIGIVKALVDENKKVYGVIGADITLDRLTEFVSHIKLLKGRHIIIFDKNKKILSYPDKNLLFHSVENLKIKNLNKIFEKQKGYIKFKDVKESNFMFFHTDENNGWKICSLISENIIKKHFINIATIVFSGIIFFSMISIIISILIANSFYSPFKILINSISNLVNKIINKIPYTDIKINAENEINELAEAFNAMGKELTKAYNELDDNYRQIKKLDKLKSSFISIVSHELRTPITVIKGYITLIKNKKYFSNHYKNTELINILQKNINRLQTLIDDLLDLSKIESGVFPVVKTRANIKKILNETIAEVSPIAKAKKIRIIKKYDNRILYWNFDITRLAKVFFNVLSNAIKFSFENSIIIVNLKEIKNKNIEFPYYVQNTLSMDKKYLLISITDKGIGIEKENIEKIFDKFYQVEDPLTRKYSGIGISLSISRSIIKEHNGYMWAVSKGKNKGSTFFILLPE